MSAENLAGITLAGESHIGLTRRHNEDSFLVFTPPGGCGALALIADGIGGHSKGELASYICCREFFRGAMAVDSAKWDEDFLRTVLHRANERIFNLNCLGRRIPPMGCTVVAAIFFKDHIIAANAGDSRLYEYDHEKNPALTQLSVDHRPGAGELHRHRIRRHRGKNMVNLSIGTQKYVEPEIKSFARNAGTRYLLCSDGLYSKLPDAFLTGMLGSDHSPREMTGKLLREALLAGERDNITLICAVPDTEAV